MRKLALLASLCLALIAMAAPVTPTQALRSASSFMKQHRAGVSLQSTPVSRTPRFASGQQTTQPSFYIFNTVGNQGYVIVSGDDRTVPILGYIDNGNFDPNKVPDNMRVWLEGEDPECDNDIQRANLNVKLSFVGIRNGKNAPG